MLDKENADLEKEIQQMMHEIEEAKRARETQNIHYTKTIKQKDEIIVSFEKNNEILRKEIREMKERLRLEEFEEILRKLKSTNAGIEAEKKKLQEDLLTASKYI